MRAMSPVIPSLVDTDRLRPRRHAQAETLTVGWVGSPSTSRYLGAVPPRSRGWPGRCPTAPSCSTSSAASSSPSRESRAYAEPWTPDGRGRCPEAHGRRDHAPARRPVDAREGRLQGHPVHGRGGAVVAERSARWARSVDEAGPGHHRRGCRFEALEGLAGDDAVRARLGAAGRERASDALLEPKRWARSLRPGYCATRWLAPERVRGAPWSTPTSPTRPSASARSGTGTSSRTPSPRPARRSRPATGRWARRPCPGTRSAPR